MLTTDPYDPPPALQEARNVFLGQRGGWLYAVDKKDGGPISEIELGSVPVFDGLVAARGRLFLAMKDGSVVCMK